MYPGMENALLRWVNEMYARGGFVSGDNIQRKKLKVAGRSKFKDL